MPSPRVAAVDSAELASVRTASDQDVPPQQVDDVFAREGHHHVDDGEVRYELGRVLRVPDRLWLEELVYPANSELKAITGFDFQSCNAEEAKELAKGSGDPAESR